RSFPPFPPFVARFRFPTWQVASDLSPVDFEQSGRRRRPSGAKLPAAEWTKEQFTQCFLSGGPRGREEIISTARAQGLTKEHANSLFKQSIAAGLATCNKPKNPSQKRTYTIATA